jgi:hypothetical protein
MDGPYALIESVRAGEHLELTFPLLEYETVEAARSAKYRVQWRGSFVLSLEPAGAKVPLYAKRAHLRGSPIPLTTPRYPQ